MRPAHAARLVLFVIGCGEPKLTVVSLKPNVGPYTGGDPATIHGSGFQTPTPHGMKVYFGKRAAQRVVISSDREIVVEPPAGEIGQTVDVEIVFDDARTARLPRAYTYIDPIGK